MSKGPYIVLDVSNLFHRAWHSFEHAKSISPTGEPFNTVFGFFSILTTTLSKLPKGSGVYAACDSKESFRRATYPEYKKTRKQQPGDFYTQLAKVKQILATLGVPVLEVQGWEADDIIAGVANKLSPNNNQVVIVSDDRDLVALVNNNVSIYQPGASKKEVTLLTPEKVLEKYGVAPNRYLEFAAVRGDTADNLPGVPSIGPVKARALINAFWFVGTAFQADPKELIPLIGKSSTEKLLENKDLFNRNLELMELYEDILVDVPSADHIDTPIDALQEVLRTEGLYKAATKLAPLLSA